MSSRPPLRGPDEVPPLDEPTDDLDLESAEALQDDLESYEGTVLAVTHDRWFARAFDRFLVFGGDGTVRETPEPVWDETRLKRALTTRASHACRVSDLLPKFAPVEC